MITLGLSALLAFAGLSLSPAQAADPGPDVHVVSVDHSCGGKTTDYRIDLRNLGAEDRAARLRIRWVGSGMTQLGFFDLEPGRGGSERVHLDRGERAVAVVRSQGEVIMRVDIFGDCAVKTVAR